MHDRKRDLLWQKRIITEVYFFVVRAWAFVAFHYVADAIFLKSMPHNTHRCQIKRFWHRSRCRRELAPLCTHTHMYKQINQTNYTILSLSQTSVFYCLSPLPLPRKCFFIAWVNLAPEQSRWSRLGHLWAMEGHRFQMHHKWIWHVFWPT